MLSFSAACRTRQCQELTRRRTRRTTAQKLSSRHSATRYIACSADVHTPLLVLPVVSMEPCGSCTEIPFNPIVLRIAYRPCVNKPIDGICAIHIRFRGGDKDGKLVPVYCGMATRSCCSLTRPPRMPEGLKKDPQLLGECLYLHRAKETRLGRLAVAVVDQVAHANSKTILAGPDGHYSRLPAIGQTLTGSIAGRVCPAAAKRFNATVGQQPLLPTA